MTPREPAQLGMIGLGTMGRALARNVAGHGFPVAAWDRDEPVRDEVRAAGHGSVRVEDTLAELVESVAAPRRLVMMITAGRPVDLVLDQLEPILDAGDVVVDGGNSRFQDTRRRQAALAVRGVHLVGMGVSGGEDGALHGPSLMPGGSAEAWTMLRPILEAIAARTEDGPCVTHVGPDGAGHFVKMVHNGIEYADMQLLAEAYDLLRRGMGLDADELAALFERWNRGPLESYLVEITARIFAVRDPIRGAPLVEQVLDRAGSKGTGRWTVETALELAVPVPTIAAALDARVLSSLKDERVAAGPRLGGPPAEPRYPTSARLAALHDALLAAKACTYAQGLALVRRASDEHGWGVEVAELARIWKGGCIIRARFLDRVREAFAGGRSPASLLVDPGVAADMPAWTEGLRATVTMAVELGIPVPALAASLAYYDAYRSPELPQNLVQAQRDAFGAHGYVRRDDPEGGAVHTEWLG